MCTVVYIVYSFISQNATDRQRDIFNVLFYTDHYHSNLILLKYQSIAIHGNRDKFGHGDLWVAGHGVPLLILHGHREGWQPRALQIAGFCCGVRARALEVIGAVVKGFVMRVTRDGADSFSNRLTRPNAILHLTLFMGPAGKLMTLHLDRQQVNML